MANKTLSTSTLSLKFMQNAHRAKQLKEVELDRAEVKDDGKWEISDAVRRSWGTKEVQPESSNVHEESYMPFLFSSKNSADDDDDGNNAGVSARSAVGRRIFNKKGKEDVIQVKQSESKPSETATPTDPSSSATKGRKVHPRPISISASGMSGQLRGFDELEKPKNSKTARQAIFESSGVGIDLRAQARIESEPSTSATAFMKPAGVDDPKDIHASSSSVMSSKADGIITSARQKKVKRVRERDDTTRESEAVAKKQKKKKKNPE